MMEDVGHPLEIHEASSDAPSRNGTGYRYLIWAVPISIIVVDQVLKAIVVRWLGPAADMHRWELAGNILAFEYVENTGAAFGVLPDQTGLLAAMSAVIAAVLGFMMWRESRDHPLAALAIGLILGGAIGNIIDRIRLGYVVDFIAVGVWPKFNVADSAITVGIVLLLWSVIQDERAARKEQRQHG